MSWLEREAALLKLGVKAQTLYAYVSRGQISAQTHPDDPRSSLYSEADIDRLVRRRRRGRSRSDIASAAIAWGDPVMETQLTTVRNGRLIYRGVDAISLAEHAAVEDVAALLWQCPPLRPVTPDITHLIVVRRSIFLCRTMIRVLPAASVRQDNPYSARQAP